MKGECFESALELGGGVVVGFFFRGDGGPVSFGGGVVVGFFFRGDGGQSASGAVKGECFESALELSSSAGNGGESASGAVKGECFESALELGGGVVVGFFFGGTGASQLPGL